MTVLELRRRAALLCAALLGLAACNRAKPADDQPVQQTPSVATTRPVPAAPCDSASTQLAMNACHAEQARIADSLEAAQFAAAREALHRKGADDQIPQLEAAEKAWNEYRDAQCEAEAGLYAGGSLAPLVTVDCRGALANRRAAELKQVYEEWARQ